MNDNKWERLPEFPILEFVIVVLMAVLFAAIQAFL